MIFLRLVEQILRHTGPLFLKYFVFMVVMMIWYKLLGKHFIHSVVCRVLYTLIRDCPIAAIVQMALVYKYCLLSEVLTIMNPFMENYAW